MCCLWRWQGHVKSTIILTEEHLVILVDDEVVAFEERILHPVEWDEVWDVRGHSVDDK